MNITKEMIFDQFKDATKKDQSKKKETFTHRISFLKQLKEDIIKVPKNFSISIFMFQIISFSVLLAGTWWLLSGYQLFLIVALGVISIALVI